MGTRLSENEKLIWICILFPPFLIFLPFIVADIIVDSVRSAYYRRKEKREAPTPATDGEKP